MSRGSYSEGPITHWGKIPVYITTIVMGVEIIALILGVLGELASPISLLQSFLVYEPGMTWPSYQIWRAVMYPFVDTPSFFAVFGLCFLWFYGREMENYLGRIRTIVYYSILLLGPVLFATLFWLLGRSPGVMFGGYFFGIGVIIGFATLYPGMEWYFGIKMKWVAWVSVGLGALSPMQIPGDRLGGLLTYLMACAAAWGYIRWLQLGGEMPAFNLGGLFKSRPKLKVVRGDAPAKSRPAAAAAKVTSDVFKPGASVPPAVVDQILEKVANQGIGSLTPKERQLLEKHSNDLKKRAGKA